MVTELKDVLHFYLGCDIKTPKGVEKLCSVGLLGSDAQRLRTIAPAMSYTNEWQSENKPILRPLSSMTEEEGFNVLQKNHPYHMVSLVGLDDDGRYIAYRLMYSTRKSKIKYDTFPVTSKTPNSMAYLISKGFDLFGLLESGQALPLIKSVENK